MLPRSGTALRSRLPRQLPWEPWSLLVPLVFVQWIGVALFWRAVTHNGWLFYHGGDQTWYYTSSWLLGRGDLPETQIGYGWSFLLTPLTWITGPNFHHAGFEIEVCPACEGQLAGCGCEYGFRAD